MLSYWGTLHKVTINFTKQTLIELVEQKNWRPINQMFEFINPTPFLLTIKTIVFRMSIPSATAEKLAPQNKINDILIL